MTILSDITYWIIFLSGITGIFVYICKKYTIEKVKELEEQLSKIDNIKEEERDLLLKIRLYINEYDENKKKIHIN